MPFEIIDQLTRIEVIAIDSGIRNLTRLRRQCDRGEKQEGDINVF